MTKLTSVRARGVSVPLDVATSLSNRRITHRHYGLVEVAGDDGNRGIGFCYVGNSGSQHFPALATDLLSCCLVGQDAHRVEGIWQDMYHEILLQGRTGMAARALSAIDTALWDRNARAANLPLYKYLGAANGDRVPAYASGGYYIDGKTPEHLADEMAGYVADGFDAVKLKVGKHSSVAEEESRLRAVRERVGAEVKVMLDANNAWSDLPTALSFVRAFEKYDPWFIEEPFGPDDIDNHARLGRLTPVSIATGEIEAGRWRFKELMDKGGATILQTDACVCGGVTEFRRIAATASSYGLTLMPHWFHDLHAHLVAATPNATHVEFFPDDQVLNFRRLVDRQLEVDDGHLVISDRPGLGFDFLTEAVEQHATTEWITVEAGR